MAHIRALGDAGLTAEEGGAYLAQLKGLPPETFGCRSNASARLCELRQAGFLGDSGRRRATRAGCTAMVLVATAKEGDGSVCVKLT